MGRKHTRYSTEFRAEAVRLADTSGPSIRQVAMDLGISNESLRRWIALARERPAGTPLDADERAELTELRRRVKVLETEREILRKAGRAGRAPRTWTAGCRAASGRVARSARPPVQRPRRWPRRS